MMQTKKLTSQKQWDIPWERFNSVAKLHSLLRRFQKDLFSAIYRIVYPSFVHFFEVFSFTIRYILKFQNVDFMRLSTATTFTRVWNVIPEITAQPSSAIGQFVQLTDRRARLQSSVASPFPRITLHTFFPIVSGKFRRVWSDSWTCLASSE